MNENTKFNKFGKIKSRSFALILLILSCSLVLSAFKSLGRTFEGKIVFKNIQNGFIRNNYNLYINQEYNKDSSKQELNNKDILNVLLENLDDYTKVGVSYFAYEDANISMIIRKEKYSPYILINNTKFLDQGLFWFILSLIGILISIMIYINTLNKNNLSSKKIDENDNEEIEL